MDEKCGFGWEFMKSLKRYCKENMFTTSLMSFCRVRKQNQFFVAAKKNLLNKATKPSGSSSLIAKG